MKKNLAYSIILVLLTSCHMSTDWKFKKVTFENWNLSRQDKVFIINKNVYFSAFNLKDLETGFLKISIDKSNKVKEYEILELYKSSLLSIDRTFDGIIVTGDSASADIPGGIELLYFDIKNEGFRTINSDWLYSADTNHFLVKDNSDWVIHTKRRVLNLNTSEYNLRGQRSFLNYNKDILTLGCIDGDSIFLHELNKDSLLPKIEKYALGRSLSVWKAFYNGENIYMQNFDKEVYKYNLSNNSLEQVLENIRNPINNYKVTIQDEFTIFSEPHGKTKVFKIYKTNTSEKILESTTRGYHITDKEIILFQENVLSIYDFNGIFLHTIKTKHKIARLIYFTHEYMIFTTQSNELIVGHHK